jgi:pterin-4a-carbinolamine dehydratase
MTSKPWWQSDSYDDESAVPEQLTATAFEGPKGLALVKAWPSGLTDKGWGLLPPKGERDGFMPRYNRGEFNPKRVLHGYAKGLWAFAFIMRSMRLVAIDIDGKNGGLEHAKELGMLPLTLAETSKSGDGYHLFYLVDEQWDETTGFARLSDRIGIVQGVDIRATGCVYHHPQQRWNSRALAPLPEHLYDQLTHRDQKIAAQTERINKVLENNDPMEVLMMQDEILSDLAKPIPAGKRNNTLFAIGSQMQEADIENWEVLLKDRASQVGLADDEADKIVANVQRYAGVSP